MHARPSHRLKTAGRRQEENQAAQILLGIAPTIRHSASEATRCFLARNLPRSSSELGQKQHPSSMLTYAEIRAAQQNPFALCFSPVPRPGTTWRILHFGSTCSIRPLRKSAMPRVRRHALFLYGKYRTVSGFVSCCSKLFFLSRFRNI